MHVCHGVGWAWSDPARAHTHPNRRAKPRKEGCGYLPKNTMGVYLTATSTLAPLEGT